MDSFEHDLLTRMRKDFGPLKGCRLMVAVSGGPDSVALLTALSHLESSLGAEILAAHVNHRIRGAESDRDREFVERLCREREIPLSCMEGLPVAPTGNLENQLREQRYRLLLEAAQDCRATLLTAHQAEDQAETVLFKMIRGSGPRGWSGISPQWQDSATGVRVIRPLLHQHRHEILSYLTRRKVSFCTDSTNASVALDRNWIRHALLPRISSRLNPRVIATLSRTAQISRELEELLETHSDEVFPQICDQPEKDRLSLDVRGLSALPTALQRWIIRRAVTTLRPAGHQLSFEHTSAVLDLVAGQSGRQLDLPHGLVAYRDRLCVAIRPRLGRPRPFCSALAIPGKIWIEPRRVHVEAGWSDTQDGDGDFPSVTFAWGGAPLSIRDRQPGDMFCSRDGRSRKLNDLLSEEGIPFLERDHLMVLSTRKEIIWVEGLWVRPSRLPQAGQAAVSISVRGETFLDFGCLKKG